MRAGKRLAGSDHPGPRGYGHTLPEQTARWQAADAITALLARIAELEEGLRPFAKLAGPINGEEGRPSYLEAISGPNGNDELQLSPYVGDGTRLDCLDAEDFRRARTVLSRFNAAERSTDRELRG